jgi:hypothetical protein
MHSPIHIAIAHESARARVEARDQTARRRPFAALRARRASRALAAAPGIPSRAAPGTDAVVLCHPFTADC